jgi:hypothetical protein
VQGQDRSAAHLLKDHKHLGRGVGNPHGNLAVRRPLSRVFWVPPTQVAVVQLQGFPVSCAKKVTRGFQRKALDCVEKELFLLCTHS